jgi:hypothetical protein
MRTATPISTCSWITERSVGDRGVDLDAAVHRAGMHDDGVGLGLGQLVAVEAVEVVELAHRGDEAAGHALGLEPEHHHHVDALQPLLHVVEHLAAPAVDLGGQQGRWRDQAHPVLQLVQQRDVGAGDAGVQDVAADRDRSGAEPALAAADGQRVEQRLGRVLMRAVAGVDHRRS